jgi:hypothetical protein
MTSSKGEGMDGWTGDADLRNEPDRHIIQAERDAGLKPEWLTSQLRARDICEQCASETAATTWAGTGERLCWTCCEARQDAFHARQGGTA